MNYVQLPHIKFRQTPVMFGRRFSRQKHQFKMKGVYICNINFWFNGFTQCHACVVQTTTRYAGVHKKLYKKITNRITIRMFKSIVKKKGDFNGK